MQPVRGSILATKRLIENYLLSFPHVNGVGIGYRKVNGKRTDEIAIIACVDQKLDRTQLPASAIVPRRCGIHHIDVQETGPIYALNTGDAAPHSADRTERHRPAPPGVSIGHKDITAGTLGCLVRGVGSGDIFILSNNHVMANSNEGKVDDPIYQPGVYDGGTEEDTIATLVDYVPIIFGGMKCPISHWLARSLNWLEDKFKSGLYWSVQGIPRLDQCNVVDAAIARPLEHWETYVQPGILGVEQQIPQGSKTALLGMPVVKSGRTTGVTTGYISMLDATILVRYGGSFYERMALFKHQIGIEPGGFSAGGDSGSAILCSDDWTVVGLLFAGSSAKTFANPIHSVLQYLNLHVYTGEH